MVLPIEFVSTFGRGVTHKKISVTVDRTKLPGLVLSGIGPWKAEMRYIEQSTKSLDVVSSSLPALYPPY